MIRMLRLPHTLPPVSNTFFLTGNVDIDCVNVSIEGDFLFS
jgi:hypothetical protein